MKGGSINIIEENDSLKLIFENEKPNSLVRVILIVLMMISFVGPIFMLINIGLSAGTFAFSLLIFLCGYYFYRVYSWNFFGKEIIQINGEKVIQIFDYGKFQEEVNAFENKNIRLYADLYERSEPKFESEIIIDESISIGKDELMRVSFLQNEEHLFSIKFAIPNNELENIFDNILAKINI